MMDDIVIRNDFDYGAMQFLQLCYNRVCMKGNEYAAGTNRFNQIRTQARLNKLSQEAVIKVLLSKHITMLTNVQNSVEPEEFIERAADVVAYFILWYNLINQNDGEIQIDRKLIEV